MPPQGLSSPVEREINAEWGFNLQWPRVQAVDVALTFSRADAIFRPATVYKRRSATWV